MLIRTAIIGLIIFSANALAEVDYLQRQEVQAYINDLVSTHQLDRKEISDIFRQVKQQKRALEIIQAPHEAKPWYVYRRQFLAEDRVIQGAKFWHKHRALIEKITKQYEVPAEMILAIVGIETYYGKMTGGFPVLDILVTLGFDYPRRASFFRSELTELLLLGNKEDLPYQKLKGSYAGAMGIGQFIPSSYRNYAIDYDNDGRRDLWDSIPDALASVANYLVKHGWSPGDAVANVVELDGKINNLSFNSALRPSLMTGDLEKAGVVSKNILQDKKFALFAYDTSMDTKEYWVGYHNFYVITRYNHSRRYALAVHQLSQSIAVQYQAMFGQI